MSRLDKNSNEGKDYRVLSSFASGDCSRGSVSPSHVCVPRVSIGYPLAPAKEPAIGEHWQWLIRVEFVILENLVMSAAYLFDLSREVKDLGSPTRPLPL